MDDVMVKMDSALLCNKPMSIMQDITHTVLSFLRILKTLMQVLFQKKNKRKGFLVRHYDTKIRQVVDLAGWQTYMRSA